jgi:hypothetical protein
MWRGSFRERNFTASVRKDVWPAVRVNFAGDAEAVVDFTGGALVAEEERLAGNVLDGAADGMASFAVVDCMEKVLGKATVTMRGRSDDGRVIEGASVRREEDWDADARGVVELLLEPGGLPPAAERD